MVLLFIVLGQPFQPFTLFVTWSRASQEKLFYFIPFPAFLDCHFPSLRGMFDKGCFFPFLVRDEIYRPVFLLFLLHCLMFFWFFAFSTSFFCPFLLAHRAIQFTLTSFFFFFRPPCQEIFFPDSFPHRPPDLLFLRYFCLFPFPRPPDAAVPPPQDRFFLYAPPTPVTVTVSTPLAGPSSDFFPPFFSQLQSFPRPDAFLSFFCFSFFTSPGEDPSLAFSLFFPSLPPFFLPRAKRRGSPFTFFFFCLPPSRTPPPRLFCARRVTMFECASYTPTMSSFGWRTFLLFFFFFFSYFFCPFAPGVRARVRPCFFPYVASFPLLSRSFLFCFFQVLRPLTPWKAIPCWFLCCFLFPWYAFTPMDELGRLCLSPSFLSLLFWGSPFFLISPSLMRVLLRLPSPLFFSFFLASKNSRRPACFPPDFF